MSKKKSNNIVALDNEPNVYSLVHIDQDLGNNQVIKAGSLIAVEKANNHGNAWLCRPGVEEVSKEQFEEMLKAKSDEETKRKDHDKSSQEIKEEDLGPKASDC